MIYINSELNTHSLKRLLTNTLPDQIIIEDVHKILKDNDPVEECLIEIDDTLISVPLQAPIHIITRAFYDETLRVRFGTYRVQVAIGDVVTDQHSEAEATYCFATLYYDDHKNLITIDFHSAMR